MENNEKLLELQREQQDQQLGVATESLNRLPIFQPTLKPKVETRTFENKYGKITIEGRLGQAHKSLLETILYKRKAFALREDENKICLKILYDEYEVRKHMSQNSKYNYETYQRLIKDMIKTYVRLETKKLVIEGTLITRKLTAKNYSRKTKSNLPALAGKEIPYTVVEFGDVASQLILKEIKFTYDPKPIMTLDSGISQALVRYLKTHKNHPVAGYHLKELIENIEGQMQEKRWWKVREYLKKDADLLKRLGIVINFKDDRVIVVESHKRY